MSILCPSASYDARTSTSLTKYSWVTSRLVTLSDNEILYEIEKSEKIEVLESLTQTQYEKLLKFLNDQPKVYSDVEYRTNDQVIRKLKLSGIYDFFG